MTPEAEFLLASLRREATKPSASLDWDALLLLAESHGVLPLFYQACTSPVPEKFITQVHKRWMFSQSLAGELEHLLQEFGKQEIECLALKGPVLAELLYGLVSLRPSDDLDLLIRPEDFSRAESLILSLGFKPTGPPDDYHRDFESNGIYVELHFGAGSPSAPSFDLSRAWARARLLEFRSHAIRFLSPIDLVLYLSLHALKHSFARLIWVLDISHALEALDPNDSAALLDEASSQRLRKVVLISCEIARRSFRTKLPAGADDALRAQPALVRQAAEMENAILATVADPTTSVHDASRYLQLADNPGRRWRQRLQFFRPTQQDYHWVAQHHLHPRCAPLVRPFRLLFKYGAASTLHTLFPPSADKR